LQFLRQTSPAIERKIREEIAYSIQEGVDVAAISGTGLNNQPTGILNHPDVPVITALGTNGGALDRAKLIAIETALTQRNLRGTSYGWLINALTRGALKNTPIAAGSDKFIMETNDRLLDYPVVMSNMVPSNLTKATGTNLSAAIFGDWKELYLAQWGGIDLIVDPYTLAVEGQIKIVAQGFFNVMVHRPEAFAYYKDIVTA
jgi:HK97 family phage major capsid protein